MRQEPPTLGVEEEFHLYDPGSCHLTSKADLLFDGCWGGRVGGGIKYEMPLSQVEIVTPVSCTLTELGGHLTTLRRAAVDRASEIGCLLIPSGTPPLGDSDEQNMAGGERYQRIRANARGLLREHLTAALHVHVGVPDRSGAVAASNRIRPWLPVLTALTGNSPYWLGVDTEFSSWRTVHRWRWPVSGPPPIFRSDTEYDGVMRSLTTAGVIVDAGMAYWDVRLSPRYPTVEIRIADVPCRAAESVMLAGVVRALVMLATQGTNRHRPDDLTNEVLRGQLFVAARDGLDAVLTHPSKPDQLLCARDLVEVMVEHVRPTLAGSGDDQLVIERVEWILREGNGASRQRRVAHDGEVVDLVRWLATEMTGA